MVFVTTFAVAPAASAQESWLDGAIKASAAKASAQESWSWKLYDLRDLIGLIPPTTPADEAPSPVTSMSRFMAVEETASKPAKETPDNVDKLMDKLCDALPVNCTRLFAGVYGIEAEETEHTQIQHLLEQIRALYAEHYEVQIIWFAAGCAQAPAVGDAITPTELMHRHDFVVARHTPTPLALVTRYSYVSDVAPIVGASSVGYGVVTKNAEDGLRVSILVGAGKEEAGATSIRVVGELRKVTKGRTFGPLTGKSFGSAGSSETERSSMELELPTVSVRSVQSDVRIGYGKLTVLSVLDGFDAGECFVLAGSVRKLDD
ncbi:MAG: hypothetical protein WBE26_14975 [Phycisphaerae bacterium]